ncbi:MAG: hypothetical protein KAR36_13540 [Candidatus Latescibacteria bacterium]|nr:hypothetical protein [Candidatus Latescibacterota bacterium]
MHGEKKSLIRFFELYRNTFKRHRLTLIVSILAYTAITILFFSRTMYEKKGQTELEKAKTEFVSAIEQLTDEEIAEAEVERKIKVIFNSVNRSHNNSLEDYGYINLLEDTIKEEIIQDKSSPAKINTLLNMVEAQKKVDPYFGLANEQKIILQNLELAIKANNQDIIQKNFEEIREIVKAKNREIEEVKTRNKWNVPIGLTGLILTILFGVLSVLFSIIKVFRKITIEDKTV